VLKGDGRGGPNAGAAGGQIEGGTPRAATQKKTDPLSPLPPLLTSARSKRLLGVKQVDVYALGFYADGPALAARAAAAPSVDDAFLASLADDAGLPKTVRIVVTTGLMTRDRFLKSVKESLVPALAKKGAASSFDAFAALFEGASLAKGSEIVFSNAPDGGLAVRIEGKDAGAVKDKRFGPALFGLWLGEGAVSPGAKAAVADGVRAVRAAAAPEK
jgi:hypothetical protein